MVVAMDDYGYESTDICGASKNIADNSIQPLNGLRHSDSEGNSGWFLWRGEYSDKDDFFKPTHIEHIVDLVPDYLFALSPGSRFLVDTLTDYKDVWFDKSLLDYPDTE